MSFESADEQLRELRRQFNLGEYAAVVSLAQPLLDAEELSDDAAIMAGESATKEEHLEQAVIFYGLVQSSAQQYTTAQLALAEVERELGHISKAETAYQNVLDRLPENEFAHTRIAFLKMATGRVSAAAPHLRSLLKMQRITWIELGWLAVPDRPVHVDGYLEKCRREAPTDPAPLIGLAIQNMSHGKYREAVELLNEIRPEAASSDIKEVLLMQCILQTSPHTPVPKDVVQRFERYAAQQNQAGLFTLGILLETNGLTEDAILCFARCVNGMDHLAATQHLLSLLARTEPEVNLDSLRRRITLLSRLEAVVKALQPEVMNGEAASEVSTIMTGLGRHQEAAAWGAVAQNFGISISTDDPLTADIHTIVQHCLLRPLTLSNTNPPKDGKDLSLEQFTPTSTLLMTDEAARVGIDFTYFESPDETTPGRRMIEFTGGGVGVLDLDNDTWPDLHLTQGTDWPISSKTVPFLDAVYRNLRGQRFVNVAVSAGLIETGFSQGIACGDLNNDGFTDIIVANIGTNSYWMNQGDGTFEEFLPIKEADQAPSAWTSSCAIADLNADSLPDIFEVHYVTGDHFDSLICQTEAGPRVCTPQAFESTLDRLLLNQGDGTFVDCTTTSGINLPGNGLGVIITNLDDDPLLEVFVANDAMPNALWDNAANAGEIPKFCETAVLRGVAVSSEGVAQACMGVAADDFNSDGTTDLFVTNYFNEPNAFYVFSPDGFATDQTLQSGIRRSSMSMLGFGVQSLDANIDRNPDVFLVNGDLDDFSHEERLFRMPPQLLINTGNGVFRDDIVPQKSDVRNSRFRGRGMAKCDWNQDGHWDMAVSCLGDPAKLVTLQPEAREQMAMVKFIGTVSNRDAIGLKVFDSNGKMQALHSGSGYMASNQNSMLWPQGEDLIMQFVSPISSTIHITHERRQVIVEGRVKTYNTPQ